MESLSDDKELLLRCALTYNWDVLISLCSTILHVLSSSVRDRDYDRHQRRVAVAKAQLTRQDQWGNNVLHAACYNKPPLLVIASILYCARAASLQVHLVLTRDLSTPLSIACATGASTDVIRVLLDPPLGLDNGGLAVSIPDARGCTPLSELVIYYELQRGSPSYRTAVPLEQVNLIGDDYNNQEPLLESFWIIVELLIRSAWSASHIYRGPWISIMHGTANVAESCPTALTSLICRCYPAMTTFANRKGILPLHLAVQRQSIQERTTDQVLPLAKRNTMWIQTLVDIYPAAVRQPFPNGRSVVCQAIASGLQWHVGGQMGPIQYLWKQDPEVLSRKDTTTGLYPFLLAATVPAESDCSIAQLDTIFGLLRLYPQLLADVVDDTTEAQQNRYNQLLSETFSATFERDCQVVF
jgi:hypothetical protein